MDDPLHHARLCAAAAERRGLAHVAAADLPAAVAGWLNSRNVGPRTWNNYLSAIISLYRFARLEGHLSEAISPVERIQQKIVSVTVGTYSPEELIKILKVVPREWLPTIVLGAFAGLRPEEICPHPKSGKPGLRWEDIIWDVGINVPKEVSKVRNRRLVPIDDSHRAFLEPWRHSTGPVAPKIQMCKITSFCGKQSGVKWQSDGLRHSYASYRLAITGDIHSLATEMGNSVSMIQRHYLVMKHPVEARRWFDLRPDQVIR